MSEQMHFLWRQLPNLLWGFPGHRPGGLVLSILLSCAALCAGFCLAIVFALGHHSRFGALRWVTRSLVWVIRGIPLLVLLVLLHQFLGAGRVPGVDTSTLGSAFVALTLYSGAYLADVLHAGIQGMPQQLVDDARLQGASPLQVARTVVLPYAVRTTGPALLTQAITVFKDSSVVIVLGVADLTTNARIALGSDVANAPYWVSIYLLVGALYFIVAFGLGRVANVYETRLAQRMRTRRRLGPFAPNLNNS